MEGISWAARMYDLIIIRYITTYNSQQSLPLLRKVQQHSWKNPHSEMPCLRSHKRTARVRSYLVINVHLSHLGLHFFPLLLLQLLTIFLLNVSLR